jgi:hypothetical protein
MHAIPSDSKRYDFGIWFYLALMLYFVGYVGTTATTSEYYAPANGMFLPSLFLILC